MIKLLHIADVHFDTGFACKSADVRNALRSATRKAFEAVVDEAIRLKVDVLLIAGDLLDDDYLRFDTEQFLIEQVSRLDESGIVVVYVAGNHDPGLPSARIRQLQWPSNLRFIGDGRPEVIELNTPHGPLRIVGAGHETARVADNLAAAFPQFDDGVPTVGVLHAAVDSGFPSGEHGRYAPCSVADLESRGYHYWALGHIHSPGPVRGRSEIWYAGCLQGRHFREDGVRGGCLVTIHDERQDGLHVEVELRGFAPIRWEKVVLEGIGRFRNAAQLHAAVRDEVDALKGRTSGAKLAVRVSLKGESELWRSLSDEDERLDLADEWRRSMNLLHMEVDASQTFRPIDMAALRDEPTVLREALCLLDDIIAGGSPARALLREVLPDEVRASDVDVSDLIEDHQVLMRSLAERFRVDV